MSNAATRAALAAAAATVEGINCTAYYRQSLAPGDAFVRLSSRTRSENGFGFMDTWQIWLALPQDAVAAEKYLDSHVGEITAAISAEVIVTTVTPSELVLGANSVNGVIFEGVREDAS